MAIDYASKGYSWLSGGMDLSQEVFEANRPYYSSIYASLDRAKQISAGQVKQAYAEATGQTYLQGQQAMSNIGSTAFGAGYKGYLQNQLQQSLNTAYDKYRSGMASDITKATEAYDTAMSDLTSGITKLGQEQGAYELAYDTKAFEYAADVIYGSDPWKLAHYNTYQEYLDDMFMKYGEEWTAANDSDKMLDRKDWEKQLAPSEEEFLQQQQLAKIEFAKFEGLFDDQGRINEDAVKTAVYDEEGNFSTLGVELFDYIMRNDPQGYESYQDWLKENDEDLYLWSVQRSIMGDPSNAVSAMKHLGADGVYSFMERFGGLTENQTKQLFKGFDLALRDVNLGDDWEDWKGASEENLQAFEKSLKSITNLYGMLGLNDIEMEYDGKTSTVGDFLNNFTDKISKKNMSMEDISKALENFQKDLDKIGEWQTGAKATAGAGAGAAVAGALLMGVPFLGFALFGAGVAAAAGGLTGYKEFGDLGTSQGRMQKQQLEEWYKAFSVQSASIAMELRRQTLSK